ncbi:MAG: efflux RND transporter permease subunit [Holosporales bacterium]
MVSLPEFSIRRPVFATVLNLLLVLVGLVAATRLAVREYPNIDSPVVTVDTRYVGASAEVMESQVTKPLEDALSGIEGIDFIRAINRAESSQITVQFRLSRDPDGAANDVRDRVTRTRARLPDDIDDPVIARVEADATPIMWVNVNSEVHSALEVSEAADLIVQDRLQTLDGVAQVRLFAERRYSMRVWLDRDRLAAYQITPSDVQNALNQQNIEIPAGRIEGKSREFTVLAQTDLNTPEDFENIILRSNASGSIVRLKDVAKVAYGPADERQIARYNNRNSIALGIIKQSIANPLEISSQVRKILPDIEKLLPQGMRINIAYDASVFIRQSIRNVFHTIVEATVLVVLVTFVFLRTLRATVVPLVAIPVSLIGALTLMYAAGFTINTLTMLSMVIAIGLVVDDAIVVLENSYRHLERGLDPLHAAIKSMREISFAVIAMTLTLAAVFAPMAFSTGKTGRLFIEFALTLSAAVLISGFVALTLTPTMCARMLRAKDLHSTNRFGKWVEALLERLEAGYKHRLIWILANQRAVLMGAGICAGLALLLFSILPRQLTPIEDRGVIFSVTMAPEGSTVWYSDTYLQQVEKILQSQSEAVWNFTVVGFPTIVQGYSVLGLKDWDERSRHSSAIVEALRPRLGQVPGVLAFPINPPSLGQGARSLPIEFVLQSSSSYEELEKVANALLGRMRESPLFRTPDSDLKRNKPELKVSVDREKSAALGVAVSDIGTTLDAALSGTPITRFKRNGEQYDVIVQLADDRRRTPDDLTALYVRGSGGAMIPLQNLVRVREGVTPRELNRFNKLRAVTITASLTPGTGIGQGLDFLRRELTKIDAAAISDVAGQSREFKEASSSLGLVFTLALLFIYLVLAAQFESWRDPLIILLVVPLALFGALLAVWGTGGSINVYTQIGLVALVGLIAKNGIMIVEFANQLRDRGRDARTAVVEAATIRLRPILMTTAATVLGALPLAVASGAGAESRAAIGWIIVGGMSIGTLFTLFIVPVFYQRLSRRKSGVVVEEGRLAD